MLISVFDKLSPEEGTSAHLGGKGYGLWWMQQQGVNVPPALIIPTTVCVAYMQNPEKAMAQVKANLPNIRQFFHQEFGFQPLLSVRSGARVSMPGMMDTVLNVGLDDKTSPFWTDSLGPACAVDSFKRLITMYGNVVKGLPRDKLEHESFPATLNAYKRATNEEFPDADQQLLTSIEAVFKSWNNERAKVYRKMHNIPEDWGTAVVVQAMVFGNLNDKSGTGVLFTRNPDNGANEVVGEFLVNAQGEDVVAGIRTPMPLSKMAEWNAAVAQELLNTVSKLEQAKRDVQDVEFTIQDGKLYVLQTRTAKRSARAAVKIALDMMNSGILSKDEALKRVTARELDLAELPVVDPKFKTAPDFTGIPACSGVAVGVVATSSAKAVEMAAKGKPVVLVTEETTPEDIKGMVAASGILTMTGGSTCHAAVVARSMNRACIVGLGKPHSQFKDGQPITIDGSTGNVWLAHVPVVGGKNKDVEAFRDLVIGEGSLLVDTVPTHRTRKVVLDLANSLIQSDTEIMKMVQATNDMCDELTIMLALPTADQLQVLNVYFTDEALSARIDSVRTMLEAMAPEGAKFIGWSPKNGGSAIKCVSAKSLLDLVLLDSSAMLVTSVLAPAEQQAFDRVIKWLSAENIHLSRLNSKGGVATWTVHVHA